MLAYTNKRVYQWNQHIKSILNPSEESLSVGDRLMFYAKVKARGKSNFLSNNVFQNGEEGELIKIIEREYHDIFHVKGKHIKGYFPVVKPEKESQYSFDYERFVSHAKSSPTAPQRKRRWKEYFVWKSGNYYYKDIFTNEGKCAKDFDLAYALTVHKSQGSTYSKIIIDYNDVRRCSDKELFYTAVSRAKDEILFFIES